MFCVFCALLKCYFLNLMLATLRTLEFLSGIPMYVILICKFKKYIVNRNSILYILQKLQTSPLKITK